MLNIIIMIGAGLWFILASPYYIGKFIKDYYFPKYKVGEVCWLKNYKELGPVTIVHTKPLFVGCVRHYRITTPDIMQFMMIYPHIFQDFDDMFTSFVEEKELEKLTDLEKALYI